MNYTYYTTNGVYIEQSIVYVKNFTGIIKYSDGTKEWLLNGKTHRLDGPAIISTDGRESYYFHNKKVIKIEHALLILLMRLKGLL